MESVIGNIAATNISVIVRLFFILSIVLGMVNAQSQLRSANKEICASNDDYKCDVTKSKFEVCVVQVGAGSKNGPMESKCVKASKLGLAEPGDTYSSSGGKIFTIQSCGACPTSEPSLSPTQAPSAEPSKVPTPVPSLEPTGMPSSSPSQVPSSAPSQFPTRSPSVSPSERPSSSSVPSSQPSFVPSHSISPSTEPTNAPSGSMSPSTRPSAAPSGSNSPSFEPSSHPSSSPSSRPSSVPSFEPSARPSSSPSSLPSSLPSPKPSSLPSSLPSSSPTYTCGPSLEVNPNDPIINITTPTSFAGIEKLNDERDPNTEGWREYDPNITWQGFRANVTLDSYTIHMRFRLDQAKHDEEQTLIHFRENDEPTLDLHYRSRATIYQDDSFFLYPESSRKLFGGKRFHIRTNCWVDLKMTRNHANGEMEFLLNNGIDPVQSSVRVDSKNYYYLQGYVRFFDYYAGPGMTDLDSNGEIEFIKVYEGVVEDLITPSPSSLPSSLPSFEPSSSPTSFPSSSPTYTCGPSLEVNPNDPIINITTPTSFAGIEELRGESEDPESDGWREYDPNITWQGFRANVTLDSYTIHMRFRLEQAKHFDEQTLIHFRENDEPTLDLHYRKGNDDIHPDDSFQLYPESSRKLFGGKRFHVRTNCWVDLKMTRNHANGEMEFLLNNGIDPVQSSVRVDSKNYYYLQGYVRFFDYYEGPGMSSLDSNGEIEFIKIYEGVVEDLITPSPSSLPSSLPSFQPSPSPTSFPSSSPTYMCGPSLEVNSNDPAIDISTPATFSGIDELDPSLQGYRANLAWHGYRANATLDSYTIHMRFRLDETRHVDEQTLIHSREDDEPSLEVHYLGGGTTVYQDDAFILYPVYKRLFEGNRFNIRANCWVDLKITRNHVYGMMKFLINNGINNVQSFIFIDLNNDYYLDGYVRFFDFLKDLEQVPTTRMVKLLSSKSMWVSWKI